MQYSIIQNLIVKYKITKQRKIEFYSKELDRIYKALEKKSYDDLPVKQLHELREKITQSIENEKSKIEFDTGEKDTNFGLDIFERVTLPL